MKNTRKFLAIFMVIAMIMSMGAFGAFADVADPAKSETITVPDNGRAYDIFQIFKGDLSEGGVLSNVVYGQNGIKNEDIEVTDDELDELTAVMNSSDTEKLEVIETYVNLDSIPYASVAADATERAVKVEPGYYLIVDNGPAEEGSSISLYIVQVVDSVTIAPKTTTTTSEKKVKDTNDTDGTTSEWQDSADYDVGDDVPFKLSATLPTTNFDDYETYKLTFHDTLSEGLSLNANSIKVYVGNSTEPLDSDAYTVVTKTEDPDLDCTFEVSFEDVKAAPVNATAGQTIRVEYTAKLTDEAVSGETGNDNTLVVEYSNNPNDEGTGNTPEDKVVVFTYNLTVDKVNDNNEALFGASFTLYKKDANDMWNMVGEEINGTNVSTFEWKGLDDGEYKLMETKTPAGYNTIDDIEFTISAEHDADSQNPQLTKLSTTFEGATIDKNNSTISATVKNFKGSTLPETGGIGTTIFYIVGGVMVAAAVVFLVTKKRMKNAEN